ncbi:DUF3131 domain-containing protein [Anaeromyxobacter paludicola]|uniref:DUF3131 domain-containing protein n=1 Tax=Anaeromyxobacter paludicola TaxID=2918171 RepID=A0ABN6NBV0_9BACT|nr:DUF3131 domain-containing protein [Anaeromyxobacter paludicola]BDG10737.1 hypothetical protein AMPC_38500 [Anaeromyxobacter paludicola]
MRALLALALLAAGSAGAAAAQDRCDAPALPSEAQRDDARVAWAYFQRNTQRATGLVNAVEGFPSTSVWDMGSSLFAMLAAQRLGLLQEGELDARAGQVVATLERLPLFEGELPNKAYDTATARMADYANRPAPEGIGVSALDLGRLLGALQALACARPGLRPGIERALARWRLCRLAGDGELHGLVRGRDGKVQRVQEGRLGYEQYAAEPLAALGLDVARARRWDRFSRQEEILGVPVARDGRDFRKFGAVDALVTEPWALAALEQGPDPERAPLLRQVFEVQKRRWERSGVVTAASEDHVDRAPWFVYDAIWADGGAWRTVTPDGKEAPELRGLSVKAAFALAALFPGDDYAEVLRRAVADAKDPARGWYAGIFERGGLNRSLNANTNAVILEAIAFEAGGAGAGCCGGRPLRLPARARSCPAVTEARLAGAGGALGGDVGLGPKPPLSAPLVSEPRFLRFDGTFFAGWRGTDGPTAGGVATAWIGRATFLRFGGEGTPRSDYGKSRFLWGFGYDDWRDDTFYLHVDNWGPIRMEDSLTHSAEVNAGYRLPTLCATRWLCASPVAGVTTPFVGGPYLNARVNVTFWKDWFVMGGLGWTVPGVFEGPVGTPGWRVMYGLGRWSWRPGSFYLTYYDWGPDSRSGNGILAVGFNWAF